MKLLLTGYPGFIASPVKKWFESHGWIVDTLGLMPTTGESQKGIHYVCNLVGETPVLQDEPYDLVIHAAGMAHFIPKTQSDIQKFYDVNVQGTLHILDALQPSPPKSIIFISSVTVYGMETGEMISEDQPLQPKTPFGKSKVLAEKLILNTSFNKDVVRGIVRLPLVAGKDAPGNLGSMIKAIKKGMYFNVSGGKAVRSVVLNNDIAPFLYELSKHGGTYNFTDRHGLTYASLYEEIQKNVFCPRRPNLPYWVAWCLALGGECLRFVIRCPVPFDFYRLEKLTTSLTFDSSLAEKDIPFCPRPVLENIKEIL